MVWEALFRSEDIVLYSSSAASSSDSVQDVVDSLPLGNTLATLFARVRIQRAFISPMLSCFLIGIPQFWRREQDTVSEISRFGVQISGQNLDNVVIACLLDELSRVECLNHAMSHVVIALPVVLSVQMSRVEVDGVTLNRDLAQSNALPAKPIPMLDPMDVAVDWPGVEKCSDNRILRQDTQSRAYNSTGINQSLENSSFSSENSSGKLPVEVVTVGQDSFGLGFQVLKVCLGPNFLQRYHVIPSGSKFLSYPPDASLTIFRHKWDSPARIEVSSGWVLGRSSEGTHQMFMVKILKEIFIISTFFSTESLPPRRGYLVFVTKTKMTQLALNITYGHETR